MSEEKKNEILEEGAQALAEDELDAVAGGDYCFCAVGGGGVSGGYDNTCGCVVGGYGSGEKKMGCSYNGAITRENAERCSCVVGGSGGSYNP